MNLESIYKKTDKGLIISLRVLPKARKSEIVGVEGTELKVRIAAQPEKDKANEEIIRLFSSVLEIPKSIISIYTGKHSRHKKIIIQKLDGIEQLLQKIPV